MSSDSLISIRGAPKQGVRTLDRITQSMLSPASTSIFIYIFFVLSVMTLNRRCQVPGKYSKSIKKLDDVAQKACQLTPGMQCAAQACRVTSL